MVVAGLYVIQPWELKLLEILTIKGVLGVSICILLLIIFVISFLAICVVAVKALNPTSKTCAFNTKVTTHGFNFSLKTNEKSTPSDQE